MAIIKKEAKSVYIMDLKAKLLDKCSVVKRLNKRDGYNKVGLENIKLFDLKGMHRSRRNVNRCLRKSYSAKLELPAFLNFKKPKLTLPDVEFKVPKALSAELYRDKIRKWDVKNRVKEVAGKTSDRLEYYCDMATDIFGFYSLRQENILGVDITPNSIYVCEIDGLSGKRVLTSMTSVCMEGRFVNEDILNNADDYADGLRDLIKENDIKTKNVALSIPVSNSIVRMVTIPKMDDSEIKNALKFGSLWNNFMNVDEKREDYSIFYQVVRRHKSSESMDILFVATKLADVAVYTDIVKVSGLNPVVVDARCFAISNAFQHKINNKELNGPCVFLEFGIEENYAMVISGDKVNVYDIELSDSHRATLVDPVRNYEELDSFVECYGGQVKEILKGYEAFYESDNNFNLLVISQVGQVKTIIDKLSVSLENYRVAECNIFDCMKFSDDFTISAKCAKQNISSWAGAVGMAMRKIYILGKRPSNNNYYGNLLPSAGQYEHKKRSKYLINAMSAAISLAMLFFVVTTQTEINEINVVLTRQLLALEGVEEQYNANSYDSGRFDLVSNTVDYLEDLTEEVRGCQRKLVAMHDYLNLVILDDVWLKELRFAAPDKIEIIGGSTEDSSIVEFIALLEEGNHFDKVSLRGMSEVREQRWQEANAKMVKIFKLDGVMSDILVGDFEGDSINQLAGEINRGG